MLRYDVPRIVYASSNHAVGRTPRTERLGADVHARPDTFYGVGKVAAEALLHLYVDRHLIDAVSTRIGSFLDEPTTRRQLSTWLSPDDAVRMFHAALTAPDPGFAVIYGDLGQHPRLVGPRAGPGAGLRPARTTPRSYAAEIEADARDRGPTARTGERTSVVRSPPASSSATAFD